RCGLVNRTNPCRCANKTRGFIQAGYVDPESLLFASEHVKEGREVVPTNAEHLAALDAQYSQIFRPPTVYSTRDALPELRRLLAGPNFREAMDGGGRFRLAPDSD